MRRTEQLQGLRLMKFEDVYGRCYRGDLSQAEASEILGISERTFRRWRERYEAEGAAGLYDRRLGRVSARRAPVDEVMRVLDLFETRYPDFTAKHFHEKLVCEHGFGLSYNWLRLSLQAHGKIKPAPRRGAHRRKRPRRPVVGMMLHQDGSSHEWVAGPWWDLIVTMDDATSEVYSGFFVAEEGTMSTFCGLGEVIAENGLFCSLYADRALHYWHTPEAGGGVDKDNPTQVGRALARHRVDRGLFAAGPGPLGAHVRDLAEAPAPGAAPRRDRHHDRGQSLSRGALLAGAQRPLRPPGRGHRLGLRGFCRARSRTSSAPRRTASSRATTPCATRTARCRSRPIATATTTSRRRSGCTNIPTATWPSSTDPGVWRATAPTAKPSTTTTTTTGSRPRDPLRRRPSPGLWISGQLGKAADLTTSTQAQPPQQKRSIHMVHKAVNSVCYRHNFDCNSIRIGQKWFDPTVNDQRLCGASRDGATAFRRTASGRR